mmetsp:Transcript_12850/g.30118  ORF Transcript_12850/g.30118 Transcript_12850/m.30118 type:complete len:124 (-) Transcript_12850:31-402(-)
MAPAKEFGMILSVEMAVRGAAAWAMLCGFFTMMYQAKRFEGQARRLAEMLGIAWSALGYLALLDPARREVAMVLCAYHLAYQLLEGPFAKTPRTALEKAFVLPVNGGIVCALSITLFATQPSA